MDLELRNKNVVITGSTSGIGFYTAKSFLNEGANVLLNGKNAAKLAHAFEELAFMYERQTILKFQGDMTEKRDIVALKTFIKEEWNAIDCLVVNVGSGKPLKNNPLDMEEWARIFNINLFSAVQLADEFSELWEEQKPGSIVMISSIAGQDVLDAPPAYAAAKDGIRVFSKYLSDKYAQKNIRVNSVSPGNVFFKGGRWEELLNADEEKVNGYIDEKVPLRRFARPEEVADAVVFLSSNKASFITGSNLVIDGGQRRGI